MLKKYLSDFFSLFYPELCAACGNHLFQNEKVICTSCIYHLPYTNFHLEPDNKLHHQFLGRIELHSSAAFLYFKKGGRVQHLLHQLKYNGKKEVGIRAGELYAYRLIDTAFIEGIDLIIPVPLHNKKFKKRGFNQAELFAKGLANGTEKQLRIDLLVRLIDNPTQTKRSRYSRFENVEQVFSLKNSNELAGKHVLLIDDVVTTGSTLEACARTLMQAEGVKVSIATLAYAPR